EAALAVPGCVSGVPAVHAPDRRELDHRPLIAGRKSWAVDVTAAGGGDRRDLVLHVRGDAAPPAADRSAGGGSGRGGRPARPPRAGMRVQWRTRTPHKESDPI